MRRTSRSSLTTAEATPWSSRPAENCRSASVRPDRQGRDGRALEGAVPAVQRASARSASSCSTVGRAADSVWQAEARNHYTKQNQTYLARQVVLGLGRGVPRRLDIPGNVQDLALRLADAQQYVGAPACVDRRRYVGGRSRHRDFQRQGRERQRRDRPSTGRTAGGSCRRCRRRWRRSSST